jgi:hypothetical protein
MEYNFNALDIIFQINKREDKEILLKYSFDYYRHDKDGNLPDIQTALIKGWNSFVTLGKIRGANSLNTPSEEFMKEVNRLYKVVRRKQIIGGLITESNG